ncbi:MAG: Bug family tripartite tricarboxylate transporter substrate binding protein [Candidatus Binatia bacterium]
MKRIISALLFLLLWSPAIQAQTPFYQDKTIRIIVGYSAGSIYDLWARLLGQYMNKYIPGNPNFIVQNMSGAGSMVAANYVYNVAKPDGLTLGMIHPGLYFNQLQGRKEVQFDWTKFNWIGNPEQTAWMIYIRSDPAYKTLEDINKASEPPRCGATGRSGNTYLVPRLLEEALGLKFNIVLGYPGGSEVDLAIEKGEMHCRGGTVNALFGSEPNRTWAKTGFVRVLVQGGSKRDPRLPDVPTIYELMDKQKTPDETRRLVKLLLSPNDVARPMVGTPGIPVERVKMLREAYTKALGDPELLAETKRRAWEAELTSGEELESLAKEMMAQPPKVIERMKKILGN